jgi:hypothetical protein
MSIYSCNTIEIRLMSTMWICNMDDYVTEVNIAVREDGSQLVYLISSYKPP